MDFRGACVAFATRHRKEDVVAPVLKRELGAIIEVADVDTDRFGTFAGDVPRLSTPIAAARAKARAALAAVPHARFGLASEGTFGPLPGMPFVTADQELVLLLDRARPLEVRGFSYGPVTRAGELVRTVACAVEAARRLAFPTAGIIVLGVRDGAPCVDRFLHREIADLEELRAIVALLVERDGAAWIEPDRRAHRDPERMRIIELAALDLVEQLRRVCPGCGAPGYQLRERSAGMPCETCATPTEYIAHERWSCWSCSRVDIVHFDARAPIAACPRCHP